MFWAKQLRVSPLSTVYDVVKDHFRLSFCGLQNPDPGLADISTFPFLFPTTRLLVPLSTSWTPLLSCSHLSLGRLLSLSAAFTLSTKCSSITHMPGPGTSAHHTSVRQGSQQPQSLEATLPVRRFLGPFLVTQCPPCAPG